MLQRTLLVVVCLSAVLLADTLTLRSGRVVIGTYMGGDSRAIRMVVGDRIESFDISQVSGVQFGSDATVVEKTPVTKAPTPMPAAESAQPSPAAAPPPATAPAVAPVERAERPGILRPERPVVGAPASPARRASEIPAGTAIAIRMIDDVDSERDRVGQEFRASIDEPVLVNGETIVPRQADVVVKLVDDKQANRVAGRTELTMDIVSVMIDGRMVDMTTQSVTTTGENRTKRTAGAAAGGAALGAIIGAIAGGGKGAAIGAATGAGAGAAVGIMTKGPKVKIPAETRLTFETQYAVRL